MQQIMRQSLIDFLCGREWEGNTVCEGRSRHRLCSVVERENRVECAIPRKDATDSVPQEINIEHFVTFNPRWVPKDVLSAQL